MSNTQDKTKNIEAIYPLSPMQQGMLFHSIYNENSGEYYEQFQCKIQGDIDVPAFEKALKQIIHRHTALRTAFVWKKIGKMLQVVHKEAPLSLMVQDWSTLTKDDQEQKFAQFLQEDAKRGMNVAKAPLMRFSLINLGQDTHQFYWAFHHLLLDGWSSPIVLKEMFTLYEAYHNNFPLQLPPARPFVNYINWLQKQDLQKAETYWRTLLADYSTPVTLPEDRVAKPQEEACQKIERPLPKELSERLNTFARKNQLTINTLVQGAWAVLHNRYTGVDDVVFGATVSGRPPELPDVERMVGLFINTLPIRAVVDPQATTIDWLKNLQRQAVAMRDYEYTPLVDIHGWSSVPRDMPLFNSIVVYENYPVDASMKDQRSSLTFSDFTTAERTNYPLTLVAGFSDKLVLEIAYDTKRYAQQTIERYLRHLQRILEAFAANPETSVNLLPLLPAEEEQIIFRAGRGQKREFPSDDLMHQRFERMAAARPESTALTFAGEQLSYGQLNERANQLAHYLKQQGVVPDVLVGLYLERSVDMIVALLAVLKAGGAYLPIDTVYPAARIAFMLADAEAPILLTHSSLIEKLPPHNARTICLDLDADQWKDQPISNPNAVAFPENLIYVIYTSGSTGKPKGTQLTQRNVVRLMDATDDWFHFNAQDVWTLFHSVAFDFSVWEIWGALAYGGRLVIVPYYVSRSPEQFYTLLADEGVTVLNQTPSAFRQLISAEDALEAQRELALRWVVFGGEALDPSSLAPWFERHDDEKPRLINMYGITETTVHVTYRPITRADVKNGNGSVIGRPIPDLEIYILDRDLQPTPIGVPGEICVGGEGLGRGYLKRPELSATKFIVNPFSTDTNARLYRSGDLARFLADGDIEYLGRIDSQIKIRGFRIELGEIETLLNQHPAVREAIVTVHGESEMDRRIVGYVVPQTEDGVDAAELKEHLRSSLPEYMLPSVYVFLEQFPLTANGKLNRRALPEPDLQEFAANRKMVAPRNQVEEILLGIWQNILKVEKISVLDSFFEIGGHSLIATQLISRVRNAFDVELPLRDFFEKPTITELALIIEQESLRQNLPLRPPLEPAPRTEPLPLSFAQQRLWFLDQLAPNNAFYNIVGAFKLRGELDNDAFDRAIQEIVDRHENLRTSFGAEKGKPVLTIHDKQQVQIERTNLENYPVDGREQAARKIAAEEAQKPFELTQSPLFRVRVLQINDSEHIVIFVTHHIISDGWSSGVMVEEFAALYNAIHRGEESPLPPLQIQYVDFAAWQRNWLQGEVLQKQLEYWKNKLGENPPVLEMPTDKPRPAVQTFVGDLMTLSLSEKLSHDIKTLCNKEGVTLFMLLLAAFQALLHRYSGQDEILVGSPIANRTTAESERLIGFFVNTLVLKADFSQPIDFRTLLRQVRETTLNAYAHQDIPFEQLVEALQPERNTSHSPLFQVAFIMQNIPVKAFQLEGVTIEPVETVNKTAKFDLTLETIDTSAGIQCRMNYNTDLFESATIERFLAHYVNMLAAVVENVRQKMSAVNIIEETEAGKMLRAWNRTDAAYPAELSVDRVFQEWAVRQPDAPAAQYKNQLYSYAELNQRANRLAHYLLKKGVGCEDVVGISMNRTHDLAVAILGIIKAGAAFLNIDPSYPRDRLNYMFGDSKLKVLVTQQSVVSDLPGHDAPDILIDADWPEIEAGSDENPDLDLSPDNLAYLIYTSGSTGKPKGTMLPHRGLCNLHRAQRAAFNITPAHRVLQFSSLSFDASVWETVMALLNGACLVYADREKLTSGQGLRDTLKEQEISVVTLPPSVLSVMPFDELPSLKTVVTAGEACSLELVQRWGANRQYVNAYGPTETTVCASYFEASVNDQEAPPIGKPIQNFQLYVLDKYRNFCPIGVPGELCVGGVGLARGYLHRPEMTAEKFIPNPFAANPGERLYRTGDLVRWRDDGNVEFLGRIDDQIKIRGFRVELGEIEAVLSGIENIDDVLVIAREDAPGDMRIVAYVVSESQIDVQALRSRLGAELPDYMVPSAFVLLDEFPLTPSGKVDRKALPAPQINRKDLSSDYIEPRNEIEQKLADIAGSLLHVEQVGIHDNFFELGGHSLLATQFISEVNEAFGVETPLMAIFEKPTVAQLAGFINNARETGAAPENGRIERVQRGDEDIDELLKELEQLSDDDVRSLLSEED